jgi:peptide/nickel transport system permease protein
MTTTSFRYRFREWKKSLEPRVKEFRFALVRIRKSPLSFIGLFIILFFVAVAVSAPFIAPPNPSWDLSKVSDPFIIPKARYDVPPSPPDLGHPFGLTANGFDVYYGCVWGTITAFRIGLLVVIVSLIIGLTVGLSAGYYGGIADEVLMRFTDVIICFPGLILSMALVVAVPSMFYLSGLTVLIPLAAFFSIFTAVGFVSFSRGHRKQTLVLTAVASALLATVALVLGGILSDVTVLINLTTLDKVVLALCLVSWPGYTRVIRGEVLRTRSEDYVEAAKAVGCSDFRIIIHHIVPNTVYPILIMASMDIGSIVLLAAALSFIGVGAQSNFADWGQLIQQSQEQIVGAGLINFWYIWLIPGAFIFMFSLGWNLLGDAVRDILDPTLRRR